MEKKCFVIMPISDNNDYPLGHFARVYEYIIKPACIKAEFTPILASELLTTNLIALDIIKHIIECDMAICDLSSKNPNVLYELGIRQAFNKPVTLIKDLKTERIFDIQGFRDLEYDESLRIDTVSAEIEQIANTLKNTFENTHEVNSLVSLLAIEPAKLSTRTKISTDTELILNALSSMDKRISKIETPTTGVAFRKLSKTPSSTRFSSIEELSQLKVDDIVYNENFGAGVVRGFNTMGSKRYINVEFETGGIKTFDPTIVKLQIVKRDTGSLL